MKQIIHSSIQMIYRNMKNQPLTPLLQITSWHYILNDLFLFFLYQKTHIIGCESIILCYLQINLAESNYTQHIKVYELSTYTLMGN